MVTGPIIRMGNIEVNTEVQLGTGSNGTIVFAGMFDGREVAVKRMLIQFYDIASQETRLLRESDDLVNHRRSKESFPNSGMTEANERLSIGFKPIFELFLIIQSGFSSSYSRRSKPFLFIVIFNRVAPFKDIPSGVFSIEQLIDALL